jgi:multiple sugar transport system substrate-binding protein
MKRLGIKRCIYLVLTISLMLLSLFIFGCGKNGPTAVSDSEVVNLRIGLPSGFDVTPEEIIRLFEKRNPNIKVSIDDAPWGDYQKRVQLQMMSGDCPDVWFLESGVIMSYGSLGVAENLKSFIASKEKTGNYLMLDDTKDGEGNVWGVPHALQPTALAYNIDMFQDAGMELPDETWNFNNLIAVAKKLTKKDANGKTLQYGFITDYSITVGYYPWIKGLGGNILDETKSKSLLNSDPTTKAIQKWADLAHKENIFPPYTTYKANRGSYNMFGTGKGAMFFIQYVLANRVNKDFPNLNWDVAPMPESVAGKRYIPYVANSWVIYKKAKPEVKEAAKRWLEFWLSDEAQTILASKGDNIPANRKSFEKVQRDLPSPRNREVFIKYLDDSGSNLDLNATWNSWQPIIAAVMERIYGERVDVGAGISEMHKEVEKILIKGKK